MSSRPTVHFHCEANERIGFGHLVRCVAWAEAFIARGAQVSFAPQSAGVAADYLSRNGLARGGGRQPTIVFVDGDHYPDDVTKAWDGVLRVMVDDYGRRDAYICDAIVNFTVGARHVRYPSDVANVLRGPKYFAARRSLVKVRSDLKRRSGHNALVTLGGFDRGNYATRVTRKLAALGWSVTVATGAVFPWFAELQQIADSAQNRVSIEPFHADAAPLYRHADVCISGGGLTKYECAYVGVPAAVISQTAAQQSETRGFMQAGLVFDIGFGPHLRGNQMEDRLEEFLGDATLRADMARRGLEAFPDDPAGNLSEAVLALST